MREGDKNTKFFHCVAISNRRNNIVDSLVVNGFISLDSTEISKHILLFYTHLYQEQFSWQLKLEGLTCNPVGTEEVTWLE